MFLDFYKDNTEKKLKLFGIPIFNQCKIRREKSLNILNGLYKYFRYKKIEKYLDILGIRFFHKVSWQEGNQNISKIYILQKFDIKKKIREQVFDDIILNLNKDYKNIVLIRSGIGETYILQYFLNEYMRNKGLNCDDTCFILRRESFEDLFNMYNPEVKYFKMPVDDIKCFYSIEDDFYQYRNINFHIFVDKKFIYRLMDSYKSGSGKHYYQELLEHFGVDENKITQKIPVFSKNCIKSFEQKIKYLNLKTDKFIFFSPEALSIELIAPKFWNELEYKLRLKGYGVYWNIKNEDIFKGKKYTNLDLAESKILADKAMGIIGLCSGFIETLSTCSCKQCILYTPLKLNNVSAENLLVTHSDKLFPFANKEKIYEYTYKKDNEENLIKSILDVF